MGDFEGYDVVGRRRDRRLSKGQEVAVAAGFLLVGAIFVGASGSWDWLAIFGGPGLGLMIRALIRKDER